MAEGGLPGPAPCREELPSPPVPQPESGQQTQMNMNWSLFKPEYSSKPEEDVEAHFF